MTPRTIIVIVAAFVCSCAPATRLDNSSTAVRVAPSLPPPDTTTTVVDLTPYHVVPGDQLSVTVFGAPDLETTGIIDSAGDFAMPLAGTLHVAGNTPEEIASMIEAKLRGPYLNDPRVSINLKQAANQQMVTVNGEVQQPGMYPVNGQMTLQQAIATARGESITANIRNVIVFRTVNNQKMAAMFDLKAIRSGRAEDPPIYGNDIVVVGENAIQKFLQNTAIAFPVLGRFVPVLF